MKKRMKTLISMGLTFVMALSIIGCGQEQQVNTSETKQSEVASTTATESVVEVDPYEAAEMPETVTVFAYKNGKIGEEMVDYNDVASFKLMEELTGTHIEWEIYGGSEVDQKMQLMLASENYTDVMVGAWKKLGATQAYEDGVIVNLMDYAEYMPNFMKYLEENPIVAGDIIEDGRILYFPCLRGDPECSIFYGPVIRTDWLDKLGLDAPTDPDSLYEVLKAFKTKDPNGNGEADEIPMSGVGSKNLTYVMPMFDTSREFYIVDGQVKYGPMDKNYDDALAYLAKLYAEDLIDEEYIMQDRTALVGKITNNSVGFAFEYQPTAVTNTMADKDPSFKFEGIPNFVNSKGEKVSDNISYITKVMTSYCGAISTDCENIEGTVKWLDSFFSEEGMAIMNFGEEGVHYTMEGDEYVYTDYMYNNPDFNQDRMFKREIGTISPFFPGAQLWGAYSNTLNAAGIAACETWADVDVSMICPALTFTAEENETVANVMNQVKTYVDEKIDKIIMGQESVEVMDEVREAIKKMGIEDVLEIYQVAYERYNSIDLAK